MKRVRSAMPIKKKRIRGELEPAEGKTAKTFQEAWLNVEGWKRWLKPVKGRMDSSSVKCKYILTPCRTFGLHRTQKRTPSSKGLTPQGGSGSSLNAPFRSPLNADGIRSTPLAEKKSAETPKPAWSTPLLPKSRVKMGLSKPSPKPHPSSNFQAKSLIHTTGVVKSRHPQSDYDGSKRQSSSEKITPLGRANRLHKTILQSTQPSSSPQSNHGASFIAKGDSENHQTGGKIVFPPSPQPLQPTKESSEEIEKPTLPPKKAQFIDDFSSCSESDSEGKNIGNNMNKCEANEALEKLDSFSSPESFHGWDLEHDQESLDSDSKRDFLQKCIPNLKTKLDSSISNQNCGSSESTKLIPIKRCSQTNKLSFVKEKFRSKRRLMSNSEDSDNDNDANFSIRRNLSQEQNDFADTGSPEKMMQTKTKPNRLVSSDSDSSDDARCARKIVKKSNVLSSLIRTEECNVIDVQQDSEKENCDVSNLTGELKNTPSSAILKNKAKSKRRVLSDTDDDDDDIGLPVKPTNRLNVSGLPSVVGSVQHVNDPNSESSIKTEKNDIAIVEKTLKKTRLLSDSNDDTDDDCGVRHIRKKSGSTPEREESRSETDVKRGLDEDVTKIKNAAPVELEKCVPTSNSDRTFTKEIPGNLTDFCAPSTLSKFAGVDMTSKSDKEEGDNVVPTVKLTINSTDLKQNRSETCVPSDSDDDSFTVKKPPEKQPRTEETHITTSPNPSKNRLVVELCRLPESAISGGEGVGSSQSSNGKELVDDDDIEEFSMQNTLKTYGQAASKKVKNVLKKPKRLSYSRHPSNKSGAKQFSSRDEKLTLPNSSVKQDEDDEITRRFVECISETEDFERMQSEMQKWLVGGQQVISQIIEEVRLQRDKNMSVMEVLQEHNIDPNLVGYDPAVEEFVSFDNFLLKNNLT